MPVNKRSRTEEIASWIRSQIESGSLFPGARIDEDDVAERFGVSKTPVREALIQLSSAGLVQLRQRRGATVNVLAIDELVAMFEVMVELESAAARYAALRMSSAERDQLSRIHHGSEDSLTGENFDGYDVANRQFHEAIYRGAANAYLEQKIMEIRARLRVYRHYPFQRPGEIRRSFADHAQVLAGISGGDPDAAAAAMRGHIKNGMHAFVDLPGDKRRPTVS